MHYTVADGLPSAEIYCLLRDHQGFLWLGTDRGAARYDGYNFRSYNTREGLPDNAVFDLYQDQQNRIWFSTYAPELAFFNQETFHPYPFNQQLRALNPERTPKASLYVSPEGTLYQGSLVHGLLSVTAQGKVEQSGLPGSGQIQFVDGMPLYSLWTGHATRSTPGQGGQFRVQFPGREASIQQLDDPLGLYRVCALPFQEGILVGAGKKLWFHRPGESILWQEMAHAITALAEDEAGRIWIGMAKGGIRVLAPNNQFLNIELPQLERSTVSSILPLPEGGIWIGTLEKALFYLPSLSHPQVNRPEMGPPLSPREILAVNDSLLWVLDQVGHLHTLELHSAKKDQIHRMPGTFPDARLALFPDQKSVFILGEKSYLHTSGKLELLESATIPGAARQVSISSSGTIQVVNRFGLFEKQGLEQAWNSLLESGPFYELWAVHEDRRGRTWCGGLEGLFLYRNGHLTRPPELKASQTIRISAIDELPDGSLVFGTLGEGIGILKAGQLHWIDQGEDLGSNLINCMVVGKDGKIYAGSGQGLHLLEVRHGKWQVRNFGLGDGLPFQNVTRLGATEKVLWYAGPSGISRVSYSDLEQQGPLPRIQLRSLHVNDRVQAFHENVQVPFRANKLRFSFLGIDLRPGPPLFYRYRLSPFDGHWRYTTDTVATYPRLPPGNYEFEVAVRDAEGGWQGLRTPGIEILPPWWATWWFRIAAALAFLICLGAGFWAYDRQIKRRHHRQQLLAQWKHSALRARMNPHFTFNTLGAIQAFISTQDSVSAEHYLNMFARLIRKVFHLSGQDWVPLHEEEELLRLYLQLEQMRFGERFEFEIRIDPALHPEAMLPTMLVQPLVENAVRHGLVPASRTGKLKIQFQKVGTSIHCSIRDNGIGIRAARLQKQRQRPDHHSSGLRIVRARLQILGIADGLRLEEVPEGGTLVQLILPLKTFPV